MVMTRTTEDRSLLCDSNIDYVNEATAVVHIDLRARVDNGDTRMDDLIRDSLLILSSISRNLSIGCGASFYVEMLS